LKLYIGNKNYSSWSMRPWVLMSHCGFDFEEVLLRLSYAEDSAFKRALSGVTPAGKVPLLVHGDLAVWDSLAIVEYLAETFPDEPVWPRERAARARARSLCAEMHSGFGAMRDVWPMNIEASLPEVGARTLRESEPLRRDLARIEAMWHGELSASGGPFLMGAFTAVDAFYAPVCTRLVTYAAPLDPDLAGYVERVRAEPAVARWISEATAEHDFLAFAERYREAPPGRG